MGTPTSRFLDDRHRPWIRLLLAVLASALLHGALIFALRVGRIERPGVLAHTLTVRLAQVGPPAPARDDHRSVRLQAVEQPSPRPESRPAPAPAPAPAPQPTETPAAKAPNAESPNAQSTDAKPGMPAQAAGATVDMPLPEDKTYYPAREVDAHPVLVSGGRPVYPEQAARENVKGEVKVLMLLNENGAADEVSILDAKPAGRGFEEAVIAWLRDARFKPAMRNGRAVKARVVYHVTFEP